MIDERELPLPSIPYVRLPFIPSFIQKGKSTDSHKRQWRCRQIMARADFMEGQHRSLYIFFMLTCYTELDRLNIIAIDVSYSTLFCSIPDLIPFAQIQHNVRPDSNLILYAAKQVTEEEGFDELLDGVRGRIKEIESLRRTRELTVSPLLVFISPDLLKIHPSLRT